MCNALLYVNLDIVYPNVELRENKRNGLNCTFILDVFKYIFSNKIWPYSLLSSLSFRSYTDWLGVRLVL